MPATKAATSRPTAASPPSRAPAAPNQVAIASVSSETANSPPIATPAQAGMAAGSSRPIRARRQAGPLPLESPAERMLSRPTSVRQAIDTQAPAASSQSGSSAPPARQASSAATAAIRPCPSENWAPLQRAARARPACRCRRPIASIAAR
jgi:hypothetical protein